MEQVEQIQAWHLVITFGFILCTLEIFLPGFIALPIGLSMIVTGALMPFINSTAISFVFFGINMIVFLIIAHKFIRPRLKQKDNYQSNIDALIGMRVEVTETIDLSKKTGYIKIYGDRLAASSVESNVIPAGSTVIIERINGNRALVRKE
jgi:membrane protein implicated in regulation of membrane protease activity